MQCMETALKIPKTLTSGGELCHVQLMKGGYFHADSLATATASCLASSRLGYSLRLPNPGSTTYTKRLLLPSPIAPHSEPDPALIPNRTSLPSTAITSHQPCRVVRKRLIGDGIVFVLAEA
jgi:hypothetical protein